MGPHYPPVPSSPLRRPSTEVGTSHLVVGSYNPSDVFPSESENSEDVMVSPSGGGKGRKSGSKFASSMPSGGGGGFDLMAGKVGRNGGVGVNSGSLISAAVVNLVSAHSGTLLIFCWLLL